MKITIVLSSVREKRNADIALAWVNKKLETHDITVVDPRIEKLELLNKPFWDYSEPPENLKKISEIFKKSDAIIILSAEYNLSIPPALSNLLDHFMKEFFWKPAGIITYSTGGYGGARVAMQLRVLLSELGMITLPSIISIPRIEKIDEERLNKSSQKFFGELDWYANALKIQKGKGIPY